jgi:hypothetical protein
MIVPLLGVLVSTVIIAAMFNLSQALLDSIRPWITRPALDDVMTL